MSMAVAAFKDIPQPNTIMPLVTMGIVPISVGGASSAYIKHSVDVAASASLSSAWLIPAYPYFSWVIDPNAATGVSLQVLVSNDNLSTGFYLWRVFPLYDTTNIMPTLKIPGFYTRLEIINENVGSISPTGYVIARGIS